MTDLMWPSHSSPDDIQAIEAIPLAERGLPGSTYASLERAAKLWPERLAVTVLPSAEDYLNGERQTYAQLFAKTNQVANALASLGVHRGAAVGLLSPNTAELITALLGAQAVGIAAPVNPSLAADHISQLLSRGAADVLIAAGPDLDAAVWEKAREVATGLGLRALLALRPTGVKDGPALEPIDGVPVAYLSELSDEQPEELSDQIVTPVATDLAGYFHTGGTTGAPKLAAHTHSGEVSNAWMIAANSSLDQDSVLFAGLPLFHVNAVVVTLMAPILRGQHVVWAGPQGYRSPALFGVFWKLVEHYGIATLSGVPTVYAVLNTLPVDADVSSLRFGIVGASPLPPVVRDAWRSRTGVELLEGYGLTEATCASARNFPGYARDGSVGQRMPYQLIKTVSIDPDTGAWTDLPHGSSGVLAISGPTVFAGYVTGHDSGRPILDGLGKLVDGWLDTGDLARIDEQGFIYLTGRAKDLIIRGGHNIDPASVEDALLSHPEVTGANAVGRPDAHAGEVPVAYVTLAAGSTATPEELAAWAAEHVSERAAAPKEVTVLEALPLTDVGKPYKVGLRIDAMRREVIAALAREGVTADEIECGLVSDVLTATISGVDPTAVSAALSPYSFAWRIASTNLSKSSGSLT